MANKRIQSAGYGPSNDAYHNEYLDTGSLLAATLRKNLGGKVSLASSENSTDETKDLGKEESAVLDRVGKEFTSRAVEILESLREDLTSFFQEMSTNEIASLKIEGMIRKAEDIGYSLGVELPPFDPLRNMSGLKSGEALENAEKVVQNTVDHYKLFSISSAKTYMTNKGPAIEISLFGEQNNIGFEVIGKVVSNNDFNGNEAIDYVYSPEGGLMSVKSRSQGCWVDRSDDFTVDCQVRRYKLSEIKEGEYSLFLGEKIITEGKDKIVKALKINNDDVKFGKCRVSSTKREIVDSIGNLVRVNQK